MKQIEFKILILAGLMLFAFGASAQVYTNKEAGKKNGVLEDSLKRTEYPYALPILGKKAAARGFNLPYSAGISAQVFWQESDIIIENLMVGFNNGEMYNVDEVVRFDNAVATASALTVRPDIWLFPFLNIYGILGWSMASTDVGFGIWIPDSTNTPVEILSMDSKVDFNATTMGFGMTPTFGVAGLFIALDMNVAWTDVPQLSKPARTFVFGPRIGKSIKFKKPDRSISFWTGGFRVALNSETYGSVNLADVLPTEDLGAKIDEGYQKLDDAQMSVDEWWAGLTPLEQEKPSNKARYEAANATIDKAGELMVSLEGAVNDISNSTVQYSMDKRPKDKWNFIMGTQFQLNKHWMARFEAGFLSSRTQFMGGVQYRFGL
jgi:hypothetical protein